MYVIENPAEVIGKFVSVGKDEHGAFFGTGMFTLTGHLEVVEIALTSGDYVEAEQRLGRLSNKTGFGEATDTVVRESVHAFIEAQAQRARDGRGL